MQVLYVSPCSIVALEGSKIIVSTPDRRFRLDPLEAVYELERIVPAEAERQVCRALCEIGVSCLS